MLGTVPSPLRPEDLLYPLDRPVETIANLDALAIKECGEPLVAVASAPGLQTARPMRLHEGALTRLLQAAEKADGEGVVLHLFDAYRAPGRQRTTHAIARGVVRTIHPTWPRSLVRELANKDMAAPDALVPPPRTTGGAIDLRIVRDGQPRRMMPRRPTFAVARTDDPVDAEAYAHRRLLASLLTPEGFSNYEGDGTGASVTASGPCASARPTRCTEGRLRRPSSAAPHPPRQGDGRTAGR